MEILQSESLEKGEGTILRINVFKKNKTIFKDDIVIGLRDTDRLRGYFRENFVPISVANFSYTPFNETFKQKKNDGDLL